MTSRTVIELRLQHKREALAAAQAAYLALLQGGVKSYGIGSRNLTKLDLPALEASISKLEREVDELETLLRGGKRRKAVGVVPRDW